MRGCFDELFERFLSVTQAISLVCKMKSPAELISIFAGSQKRVSSLRFFLLDIS